MVETALVTVVLSGLFLAVLQLGLAIHLRNTLVASAAEGARYGANADRGEAEAREYTRRAIRMSLPDRYAAGVKAREVSIDGIPTMRVTVTAPLPVLGVLGPSGQLGLVVHGHAVEEGAA